MNRVKLKMTAAVLLVFLMGIAAGALGTHIYAKHQIERMVRGPAAFLFPRFMKKIGAELDLTPEQREKAAEILDELEASLFAFRQKHAGELEGIIDRHFQALKAILSPEQQERLEGFRDRFHHIRKRWGRPHERFGPPHDADARPFRRLLKERLELSEEAWQRVRPILRKEFRERRRLFRRHWNEDFTDEALQDQSNAIQMETEQALSEILSPGQMEEYRKLRKEFNEQREGRRPLPHVEKDP